MSNGRALGVVRVYNWSHSNPVLHCTTDMSQYMHLAPPLGVIRWPRLLPAACGQRERRVCVHVCCSAQLSHKYSWIVSSAVRHAVAHVRRSRFLRHRIFAAGWCEGARLLAC
jgi:hypothetical protein